MNKGFLPKTLLILLPVLLLVLSGTHVAAVKKNDRAIDPAAGTIIIDGCDSGVANQTLDDVGTMNDLIAGCAEGAVNHGAFVSCVSHLTNAWKRDGLINGREKGAIQRCAARATIPPDTDLECEDDTDCDDGIYCNGTESCADGACMSGEPLDDGTPCPDEEICNGEEICLAGACASGEPLSDGAPCDDGNACTENDTCAEGICQPGTAAVDGTPCPDADSCNGEEICQSGACTDGEPLIDGEPCDDGLFCTVTDSCQDGMCTGSGNPCEAGTVCNEETDTCEEQPEQTLLDAIRMFMLMFMWQQGR